MKSFFEDFDFDLAAGAVALLCAIAFAILAPVLAIAYENVWLILLWVPAILCVAVSVGKGWI